MSYARFSSVTEDGKTSDVYVYEDVGGYLSCCGCRLQEGIASFNTTSRAEMVGHLLEHVVNLHTVPKYTILELIDEINKYGDGVILDEDFQKDRERTRNEGVHLYLGDTNE